MQRVISGIGRTLLLAERGGERSAGPVLLAGLVLGLGVVELSSGALGQTSRFSLELLILLVLQLVGPMLVTLIGMALLLPTWLEVEAKRAQGLVHSMMASAIVGSLLLLFFLSAAITGGVLASPRADVLSEFSDVLSGLCSWSQLRGGRRLRADVSPALVSSDLMVEGLTLLLGLKLFWITAIDPLHLSASPT